MCIQGGNDNPLQYSCPENPMDRGAWQAAVRGVTKSWSQLNDWAHEYGKLIHLAVQQKLT